MATVKELIAYLENFDKDAEVIVAYDNNCGMVHTDDYAYEVPYRDDLECGLGEATYKDWSSEKKACVTVCCGRQAGVMQNWPSRT